MDTFLTKLNQIALVDRMRYKVVYDVIEDYLFESEDVVLGGSMSVDILLEKELGRDDYTYSLYTNDAFRHANTLVNKIAEVVSLDKDKDQNKDKNYWVVFLKTILPFKKFSIMVDQRPLVVITALSVDTSKLDPLPAVGLIRKKTLRVMPPKFHLIELYRTLYSPTAVDEWQQALRDERRLFVYMRKIMNLRASGKSVNIPRLLGGSADLMEKESVSAEGGSTKGGASDRQDLVLDLLKEFVVNNDNVVLIGEHAVQMLSDSDDSKQKSVLQCVLAPNYFTEALDAIKAISSKKFGSAASVQVTSRPVMIVGDFRLRRTALRLTLGESNTEFMYIYTASDYDLIPFNRLISTKRLGILVGNPFVLARFMLIELWILVIVENIDPSFAASRTNAIISKVLALRQRLSGGDKIGSSIRDTFIEPGPMQIFQSSQNSYIGKYENDDQAMKTRALSGKKFSDYYPQLWFHQNGSYRTLDSKK